MTLLFSHKEEALSNLMNPYSGIFPTYLLRFSALRLYLTNLVFYIFYLRIEAQATQGPAYDGPDLAELSFLCSKQYLHHMVDVSYRHVKEALQAFEKELDNSNYEKRSGFFDKLKQFGEDIKKNFQY